MKRWIPFVTLILFVFVLVLYLVFTGQSEMYTPHSSDPSVIYREACVECHGETGEGNGLLYPDLTSELLREDGVIKIVRNGELFMPSFPYIPDSTLKKLAVYVVEQKFMKNNTK